MNLVFEIIGFFVFAGGMGYLLLSGRIANMFRDRAPKPLLLIALITAFAMHHWAAILSEPVAAAEPPLPAPSAEVPAPPEPAPVVVRHPARPAKAAQAPAPQPPAATTEHWTTVIVEEGTPEQVFVPQATDPIPASQPAAARGGPDPYESKAKRGIKAVGRFLRLRKTTQ